MKKVITGNEAAATGALLCQPDIICAYPITPQSRIPEQLAEWSAQGKLKGKFVNVESEMSALGYVTGASIAGARVFTATSSQGLAWMHEGLHWAAGSRLPIVMANVNRPLGAPWNLTCGQIDSLSQRDTGWVQFYCESNQEVLDTIIQAYRVAETISLPVMVCLDGVYLSLQLEGVEIPSRKDVDAYLPPYDPSHTVAPGNGIIDRYKDAEHQDPGYVTTGFTGNRYELHKLNRACLKVAEEANTAFKDHFGRDYPLVESYRCDEADVVILMTGSAAGTGRYVIDQLYDEGKKQVGLLKLKMFRPFPSEALRGVLEGKKKIIVIERDISPGQCGIFYQEIKWALYNNVTIYGFVGGLGGEDITPDLIRKAIDYAINHEPPKEEALWLGLPEKEKADEYDKSTIKIC